VTFLILGWPSGPSLLDGTLLLPPGAGLALSNLFGPLLLLAPNGLAPKAWVLQTS